MMGLKSSLRCSFRSQHTACPVIHDREERHDSQMRPEPPAQRLAVNAHRGTVVLGQFEFQHLLD